MCREGIAVLGVDKDEERDRDTYGDKAVGNVERRPMKAPPKTIQKVDYFSIHHAIDQIADGAPEYKR